MAGKAVLQFVVQFSCMAHGTLRNCFCPQGRVFSVAIKTPYGRLVETAVPFHSGGLLFVALYTVSILKGCRLRRHGDSGICDHNYCGQKESIYNLYGRFVFHPSTHLPQIVKDYPDTPIQYSNSKTTPHLSSNNFCQSPNVLS